MLPDARADGSSVVHDALVHGRTAKQTATSRGRTGQEWERSFAKVLGMFEHAGRGSTFVCVVAHEGRVSSVGDFWKCQTFAASPAEPGDLPWWVRRPIDTDGSGSIPPSLPVVTVTLMAVVAMIHPGRTALPIIPEETVGIERVAGSVVLAVRGRIKLRAVPGILDDGLRSRWT